MTLEHHHEDHAAAGELFSTNQWASFRFADTKAATAIVVLMVGIFITGVILYSIVLATL
jgi:hypothetical protein